MMTYSEKLIQSAPPASRSDIERLAEKMGAQLPDKLAEFYAISDGGITVRELVTLPDGDKTALNMLFSISGENFISCLDEYDDYRKDDRIPRLCLPIGDDPEGNLFLMSFESHTAGQILFWDHNEEMPAEGDSISDFANVTMIADNLDDMLDNMEMGDSND